MEKKEMLLMIEFKIHTPEKILPVLLFKLFIQIFENVLQFYSMIYRAALCTHYSTDFTLLFDFNIKSNRENKGKYTIPEHFSDPNPLKSF
jgi:hypothetical protein